MKISCDSDGFCQLLRCKTKIHWKIHFSRKMQEILFALKKKEFIFIMSIGGVHLYALYEMQKMPLSGPDGL